MKLQDLFEQQKTIAGDIYIPNDTKTLVGYKSKRVPISGGIVEGDFIVENNHHITSLEGSPAKVLGKFSCNSTPVTSLEGGPTYVSSSYYCAATKIQSLKGAPDYVGQDFYCHSTRIRSLEGAPQYIGDTLFCVDTDITSLQNVHKHLKRLRVLHVPQLLKSHVIGVLLIKSLEYLYIDGSSNRADTADVEYIINKHLAGDRNVHECQEELIEAGLKEFARL